jgi:hypothetical protein
MTRKEPLHDLGVDRLSEEFSGTFSQHTVELVFLDTLDAFRDAKVTAFVPLLALRNTRDRLRSVARSSPPPSERPSVLFVCQHSGWATVEYKVARPDRLLPIGGRPSWVSSPPISVYRCRTWSHETFRTPPSRP